MEKRLKISIIMATEKDLYLTNIFREIDGIEFDVLLLENYNNIPKEPLDYSLKVYNYLDQMPEYFRGLSQQLKRCDIIVVIDSHYRSSFQSLSIACRLDKPFFLFQTKDRSEFLDEESNQYRMMLQVMRGADHIFSLNAQCSEYLLAEGLTDEKISIVRANIDRNASYCSSAKSKFRRYVGINDRAIVILASRGRLSDLEAFLKAVRLIIMQKPDYSSLLRFILMIDSSDDYLKYLAADLGIGKNVLFISQNIDRFKGDFFCATDIMIDLEGFSARSVSPYVLEALNYGVVPVARILDCEDPLQEFCMPLVATDFQSLADAVLAGVESYMAHGRISKSQVLSLKERGTKERRNLSFLNLFKHALEGYRMDAKKALPEFEELIFKIKEDMNKKNYGAALQYFDRLMECAGQDVIQQSEGLRFKGDCLLKLGDIDGAMEAYDVSIQFDDQNWRSYLGLGKLSLRAYSEEEALNFFRKVLAIRPNQVEALSGVGSVHRMLGMMDESIYWFHRALSLDITNRTLLFELTQASLECLDPNIPIRALESLRASIGEEKSLVMALGQLYIESGNIEEGQRMVSSALDIEMGDGEFSNLSRKAV